MAQEPDEDFAQLLDRKNPPSMLGSEKFISRIKDRLFKKKIDKDREFNDRFKCIESNILKGQTKT